MAGGIWKSARRVMWHSCWEKVWRELVTDGGGGGMLLRIG